MKKQSAEFQTSPRARPPMERMMRIHNLIQAGGFPNATRLSREFEVSTKTINRDLEFMQERLQLPIAYNATRFGYYYTQPVSAFPSLQISEGELFALLVAEKALQQYRGTTFEKPLISALRKMADLLPAPVSFKLSDWDHAISFRTSAEAILNLEVFDTLAKAAAKKKQVRIDYRKPGGAQPEERVVDPYHLANINGEWYLFAYDLLRKDIRTFVPARIQSISYTGKKFEVPKDFSLEKRLSGSFGVVSGQGEYNVVIQFNGYAATFIREKRWHSTQKLRELKDGGVELSLKLNSLEEIKRWILSWGGHAVAIEPAELVDSIRQAAQSILKGQGE